MNGNCLFVVEDWPITPDTVGGMGALIHSHLQVLSNGGWSITLLVISRTGASKGFDDYVLEQQAAWAEIQANLVDCFRLEVTGLSNRRTPLKALRAMVNDFAAHHYFSADEATVQKVLKILSKVQPDFVWAEDLLPATLMAQVTEDFPLVYSHNDWKWRIKQHRHSAGEQAKSLQTRFKYWFRRKHEESLVRRASACVTASASEASDIESLGNPHVIAQPATYSPVTFRNGHGGQPRIVHLGGMQTTANRQGLQRFMEITWPRLLDALPAPPELWVVGSLSGAPGELRVALDEAGAVCTGFVPHLTTVLRPEDVHIIPWEYDTGTRTRIPLALNHGQVIVSTRAAAACLPQLEDGINSVLVDGLPEMADEIVSLFRDPGRRRRLAQAGRDTFLQHFTREALQPQLNQFLQAILN